MFKYLALVIVLIFSALAYMYFGIGVHQIYSEDFPDMPIAHIYEHTDESIADIKIFAFYFIPSDRKEKQIENWREVMSLNLEKLRTFHELQLQGKSQIQYLFYPKKIDGLENGLFYDTEITQFGNPRALISITEEIEERVFNKNGDLYEPSFKESIEEGSYLVMLIMYEGVGASGGIVHSSELETQEEIAEILGLPEESIFIVNINNMDGMFLLNSKYLTGIPGIFGESILAHEFYHTIGVPDKYLAPYATPTSQDIMGSGRVQPIEQTYLSKEILNGLGI